MDIKKIVENIRNIDYSSMDTDSFQQSFLYPFSFSSLCISDFILHNNHNIFNQIFYQLFYILFGLTYI